MAMELNVRMVNTDNISIKDIQKRVENALSQYFEYELQSDVKFDAARVIKVEPDED